MPAWIGPLLGFALGAVFAWFCHAEAEHEDDESFRARTAIVALFGALVFAPVCAYFLLFASDWAYAYLVDSRRVPSALTLVLIVIDGLLVPAGFVVAQRAFFHRAERIATALAAVPLGTAVVTLILAARRLSLDGSYFQVTSRFGTRPLNASPLGLAVVWMLGMVVVGAALTVRALSLRMQLGAPARNQHNVETPPPHGIDDGSRRPSPKAPLLGRRPR